MEKKGRPAWKPVGEIPRIDVNLIPKSVGMVLGQAAYEATLRWKKEQEAKAAAEVEEERETT